jgi:hypothetical protein
LSIAPTWKVTAATLAHIRATRTLSSYSGAAIAPSAGPKRNDQFTIVDVGVDWSPVRSLTLSASAQRQVRDSTIPLYEYNDTIARISALLKF